ncbi:MAG: hypothetical protein SH847_25505 [Roseiflexaceae bacterium]|nr:hypothetical protein [Roseiflexaceae bacterium]
MLTRRTLFRTILWLPLALLLGSSCSGATPGVTAKLDYDLPPPLGGIMTFRLTATSAWDAPNPTADGTKTTAADVLFSLQDGLVPREPLDSQWIMSPMSEHFTRYRRQVTCAAGVPQTVELPVRLDQPGDLNVVAGVVQGQDSSSLVGLSSDSLYLRVTSGGTQIQRTPFASTT